MSLSGPILALGTTGTGVDFEYGAQLVFFLAQHVAQFEFLDEAHRAVINRIEFLFGDDLFLDKVKGKF